MICPQCNYIFWIMKGVFVCQDAPYCPFCKARLSPPAQVNTYKSFDSTSYDYYYIYDLPKNDIIDNMLKDVLGYIPETKEPKRKDHE